MSIYTLVAQLVFQIALTIAVVVNGLAILAKLSELERRLEHRPLEVDINTIKDLERVSGIKAHTLRIWEQRYDILIPKRSNIGPFNLFSLQFIVFN